ncbi:FdhF/YdeP family oxidoreductase [Paracoccus sp. (in: a-proteobacteria)]|uniref:FdhF/YdeP family oxidoreductase n=1 Tax=Paracoccus sp. TaxID=267 RepID=UPI0026DECFFF|nr:FdhF/YdeP family oxidoreductase [Paracoccus sp. (in: a-proteobacteria)]MDO5369526.1 FdhF/YdeP family oxidoreductase [Paracoccus sp. (in: a-proteobacteria)]
MDRDQTDPATQQDPDTPYYDGPAGGWGSMEGMARVIVGQPPSPAVLNTLRRQNKPDGHMCTSCAWAKPAKPHLAEFCENGAKATIWDLDARRCDPGVFERHGIDALREMSDHDLESLGRLTHPMRFDPSSGHYVGTTWDEAFQGIGAALRTFDPKSTVFYTSGRASLETSFMWQLFARLYGHNNLPDSSNMCHETTSVGLKKFIGSPVGTCVLEDFDHCDLMFFFGQNTGTSSPRFLHTIQKAVQRGCKVITFNPVREAGLLRFRNPQQVTQILGASTEISDLYLQVRPGGDMAAILGLIKRVFEMEAEGGGGVIDHAFIAEHTTGYETLKAHAEATSWDEIEELSGLTRAHLRDVGTIYARSKRVVAMYGMGLTQHVRGGETLGMMVNLMLLRGNLGRLGAGISPVRGHSNVQGQRTVGIAEKPELVPLDEMAEMFDFSPPREEGTTTVEAVKGIIDGSVRAFLQLGGNFAAAIPDSRRAAAHWADLDLVVNVATKLNRSHLLPGRQTWLLPCLVRSEEDVQAGGHQVVSIEDSLSHIYASHGKNTPASEHLLSEPAIVAGIAKATLDPNPKVPWDDWVGDYAGVRACIEALWPEEFTGYERRMREPGGFYKGNAARERTWKTESGKAEFSVPDTNSGLGRDLAQGEYTLVTLRSNDQFNTTIYGYSDRMRGLSGDRMIVLMNPDEIARAGLSEGQKVRLVCAEDDGHDRDLAGLTVTPYDLPDRCVAAYYPEVNPVIPVGLHDRMSKTPAYKGVPVRVEPLPA